MKSSVANWMVEHRHGRPQSLGYPHCNVLVSVLFWCSSTTCQSRSTASALSSLMTPHSTHPLNPFKRAVLTSPSIWMQEQIGQRDGACCPVSQRASTCKLRGRQDEVHIEGNTDSTSSNTSTPGFSTGVEYNSHMERSHFSQTFSLALHSTTEFFVFQQSFYWTRRFDPETRAFFGYTSKLSNRPIYTFFYTLLARVHNTTMDAVSTQLHRKTAQTTRNF